LELVVVEVLVEVDQRQEELLVDFLILFIHLLLEQRAAVEVVLGEHFKQDILVLLVEEVVDIRRILIVP
jgi:hypothetical protein